MTRTTNLRARRLATLALTAALGLGAAACAQDAEPTASDETATAEPTTPGPNAAKSPTESPTEAADPAGQTIDITISRDAVVPNGERVEATVGEEITLRITAAQPGEIHVHATPEQVLAYAAGTSELPLTIDQPGVVEVESHDPALVIVQLEVR